MIDSLTRTFQGREVRIREHDDDVWLHGKDTCRAVGLASNTQAADHALASLAGDERTKIAIEVEGSGALAGQTHEDEQIFVNEPGMYRLVFRSQDPMAEKFRRWAFHEVFPEIRETGTYVPVSDDIPSRAQLPDYSISHYVTRSDVYTRVEDVVERLFDRRYTSHIPAGMMAAQEDLPEIETRDGEHELDFWVSLEGLSFWLFKAKRQGTTAFAEDYIPQVREMARNMRLAGGQTGTTAPDTTHLSDESEALIEEMEERIGRMQTTGGGGQKLQEVNDQLDSIQSEIGTPRPAYMDWDRSDKREEINHLVNHDVKRYWELYRRVGRYTGTDPRDEADGDASSVLKGVSDNTLDWILYFADQMYSGGS